MTNAIIVTEEISVTTITEIDVIIDMGEINMISPMAETDGILMMIGTGMILLTTESDKTFMMAEIIVNLCISLWCSAMQFHHLELPLECTSPRLRLMAQSPKWWRQFLLGKDSRKQTEWSPGMGTY
jgi:hypothetical protein